MRSIKLTRLSLYVLTALAAIGIAQAREPGIAPVTPPGITFGLPIAVNPPPGFSLMSRTGYADYTLRDNNGNYFGQKATIITESLQVNWVPGWTVLGGSYKAFFMLPFVDMKMERETRQTGPQLGTWHSSGLGNPKIQPLDLVWNLGDGYNVGAGVGVLLPLGRYDKSAQVNQGANFWTLEPSIGFTYLKNGWNASAHLIYDINSRNTDTEYRSGDTAALNLTLTKRVGGVSVGPVAYYHRQVTEDSNNGTFVRAPKSKLEQAAAGVLVSGEIGKARLYGMYTKDFDIRNTMGGKKFWFNVSIPLDL
jgi:hypothetical protein